jgi:hypothetical protein
MQVYLLLARKRLRARAGKTTLDESIRMGIGFYKKQNPKLKEGQK